MDKKDTENLNGVVNNGNASVTAASEAANSETANAVDVVESASAAVSGSAEQLTDAASLNGLATAVEGHGNSELVVDEAKVREINEAYAAKEAYDSRPPVTPVNHCLVLMKEEMLQ